MSDPLLLQRAESKILQLDVAAQCGLRVPTTLISNDPVRIRSFFERSRHNVVAKPLRLGYFDYGEYQASVYTTRLSESDLLDAEALPAAPVIYQEHLPKALDVRVTIVGSQVFTAAIHSQTEPSALVDWRRSKHDLLHTAHALPSGVADGCLRLMTKLGLAYGALDFVLTPSGDYWFLEVNPNGQWLWIDDKLSTGISEAIAEWLMRARVRGIRGIIQWVADLFWVTARDGDPPAPDSDGVVLPDDIDPDVLKLIADNLEAALAIEADRARSIDTRLMAVASMAPIAVTVLVALVTFLASGRAQDFTAGSVLTLTGLCFYVSVQFLRALLASIAGLTRKSYYAATSQGLISGVSAETAYLRDWINPRLRWLTAHRHTNNDKITQMAVAHIAIRNAAGALVLAAFVMLVIVLLQF